MSKQPAKPSTPNSTVIDFSSKQPAKSSKPNTTFKKQHMLVAAMALLILASITIYICCRKQENFTHENHNGEVIKVEKEHSNLIITSTCKESAFTVTQLDYYDADQSVKQIKKDLNRYIKENNNDPMVPDIKKYLKNQSTIKDNDTKQEILNKAFDTSFKPYLHFKLTLNDGTFTEYDSSQIAIGNKHENLFNVTNLDPDIGGEFSLKTMRSSFHVFHQSKDISIEFPEQSTVKAMISEHMVNFQSLKNNITKWSIFKVPALKEVRI